MSKWWRILSLSGCKCSLYVFYSRLFGRNTQGINLAFSLFCSAFSDKSPQHLKRMRRVSHKSTGSRLFSMSISIGDTLTLFSVNTHTARGRPTLKYVERFRKLRATFMGVNLLRIVPTLLSYLKFLDATKANHVCTIIYKRRKCY